jgi:CRISPR/Cas system-associated endonuclease Cas1
VGDVSLLDGDKNLLEAQNTLVLTNSRLILIKENKTGIEIPIKKINSVTNTGMFGTSKKLLLECLNHKLHLRFLNEGKDNFQTKII